MTVFISVAAVLTLLAIAWVVRPLLRPATRAGVSADRLNAAIYRDQLETLERDLARGVINATDYEATRDELQLRLLDDTDNADAAPTPAQTTYLLTPRGTALLIALVLPLGSAAMYWWLGNPQAMKPVVQSPHAMASDNSQLVQMVETMAERLKAEPNNPKGWAMLARSYKVIGRFAEAEQAFEKAGDLVYTDPNMMVDFADLLAVRANNNMEGRPIELINKALALNPMHPMGLMMSGVAAYRRGEFALAVRQWERLLTLLEPGSPDAQQVEADLADARTRAGIQAPAKPSAAPASPSAAMGAGADAGKLPPVNPAAAAAMSPDQINQMVQRLAEKLKANPTDLPGWVRLGRAYKVQGKLAEADDAYTKAAKLVETDADLLTQHADLIAMRAGNKLEGRPMVLVNKALALNPKHPVALMMAGAASFRAANYAKAVGYWETALTVLPPNSPDAQQVAAEIAQARAKGGLPAAK